MMPSWRGIRLAVGMAMAGGCATQTQMLQARQPTAVQTALQEGTNTCFAANPDARFRRSR